MRSFEDYILQGDVRNVPVDKNLVKSLVEQAARRLARVEKEEITDENCDFVLEDYYEVMRILADAYLALHGYKSYSHEAPISFLEKQKEFSAGVIERFDRVRRLRHGSRYYGKHVSITDANEARQLATIVVDKLRGKLQ